MYFSTFYCLCEKFAARCRLAILSCIEEKIKLLRWFSDALHQHQRFSSLSNLFQSHAKGYCGFQIEIERLCGRRKFDSKQICRHRRAFLTSLLLQKILSKIFSFSCVPLIFCHLNLTCKIVQYGKQSSCKKTSLIDICWDYGKVRVTLFIVILFRCWRSTRKSHQRPRSC